MTSKLFPFWALTFIIFLFKVKGKTFERFKVDQTVLILPFDSVKGQDANHMQCQSTKLVVYQVTFTTFWDREKFPKQYPEWRPPAQWSKLIGKTNINTSQLSQLQN